MKHLIILLAILAMASCKTARLQSITKVVKDSTVTEITYHKKDTVITVPGDTLTVSFPIHKLSHTPMKKSNGRITAQVKLVDDQLEVDCLIDALEQRLQLLQTTVSTLRNRIETSTEIIEVPVKYVPWWVKILAWIGGVSIILMAIFFALKYFKII